MWTRSLREAGIAVPAVLALALLIPASGRAAAGADAEFAAWKPKELSFTYMGFTSKYSCEGLASKVKSVLLALGARKDVTVYGTGCAVSAGRPTPMPGVKIKVNVLEPVSGSTAGNDSAVVPAHWKSVEVKLDRDPVSQSGECELVEQIRQNILPLFAARNVELDTNCVPHQLSAHGTLLRAQVLVADKTPDEAAAR